jgi:hypothetical protein
MNPSFRVWFLIVVACVVLHMSGWYTAAVVIGYAIVEQVDRARKYYRRTKDLEDVLGGWEQCKDDPDAEEKGERTRVRLVGQNLILFTRLLELFTKVE